MGEILRGNNSRRLEEEMSAMVRGGAEGRRAAEFDSVEVNSRLNTE